MVSRGSIVSIRKEKNIWLYKVRIPFLHGVNSSNGGCADVDLPEATYCPVPGSLNTKLKVGDLVYVAVVDFNFSELVILGLVPKQGTSLTGLELDNAVINASKAKFTDDFTIIGRDSSRGGLVQINFNDLKVLKSNGIKELNSNKPLPISSGGTGANSVLGIKKNINISSNEIISEHNFKILLDRNNLKDDTIYFLYNDSDVEEV